ncbi:GIY-YIG nuclease family protein (plasmid) [Acuticoccus sp. MNP-M23]|uniref:GIY-YIG nuclease family protein n=1 Tax=Acuticoccus sp. MNP-M23 TaxID=3072793 RepID=UPI002814A3C3|nr:GIY-YIG nuclease family protein [Acuticoccus sp. MNP-M23]WMS45288.1 GIY-YIG nuclease family protein [Acuticoccus sp. MNP-M23]
MSELLGRSVRLFLADGTASGLITAEIMNWTGHVLTGSRSGLPAFLKRVELDRTGLYFLTGPAPDDPDTTQVYIGESDNVRKRLFQHSKDEIKDFWERTCVVTSKDQNITKAHARYLEARLIAIAKSVAIASVVNGTAPPPAALPEADASDMEYFIEQLRLVLPVLGFDFLRQSKAATRKTPSERADATSEDASPIFRLSSRKHGIEAQAREIDGEFVVIEGSAAVATWSSQADHSYSKQHAQLMKAGKLVADDGGHLRFAEDVAFRSPSAASAVILGRPDNGRTSWKLNGSNISYGDWQAEQVAQTTSSLSESDEFT